MEDTEEELIIALMELMVIISVRLPDGASKIEAALEAVRRPEQTMAWAIEPPLSQFKH